MEEKLDILLFDKNYNLIEQLNIRKPKTYYDLLNIIKIKIINLPKYYDVICQKENENILVNNNENYHLVKDILFIYEKKNLKESSFSLNYNELSESIQEKLDEKYNCNICYVNIKDSKEGKPMICYQCQRIFHKKCLENWDAKCKMENTHFNCPKCRYNELPLNSWKEKINYDEERNNEAYIMNVLNKSKLKDNDKNEININKYKDLENEYEKYVENTSKIFENIFNKSKEIILLINENYILKDDNNINFNNSNEISKIIFDNFNIIKNYIKGQKYNKSVNEVNNNFNLIGDSGYVGQKEKSLELNELYQVKNEQKLEEQLNNEALFQTLDRRIIFRNGLLKGIIHKYSEIEDVISKIQILLGKGAVFNLVYKASEHGDKAKSFHEKCDELNMSLVLIETHKGIRFGGFTTKSWGGYCIKKIDNNAFVFSLERKKIYDVYINEPAIGCYPNFGPVFLGCQIRIYDSFFNNGGTTCRKGLNYNTKKDYEINNGEQLLFIKDIEVYRIEAIDVNFSEIDFIN